MDNYVLSAEECRIFVENLHLLGECAFASDESLTKSLIRLPKGDSSKSNSIGMILISPNKNCSSKLYTRPDRHVLAVLLTTKQELYQPFTIPDIAERKVAPFNNIMDISQVGTLTR